MARLSTPSYLELSAADWRLKREFFADRFNPCRLCPRQCGADRQNNHPGICRAGREVKIASYSLHFGEEPPISGCRGSGTVFFSGCTLSCLFCQNYPISQLFHGEFYQVEQLAGIFLSLQKQGSHNINLVSPTPYLHHIIGALEIACAKGLDIPLVYNTSGYDRVEVIAQLEGVVDIYLPDLKYGPSESSRLLALKLSGVGDYFEHAAAAVAEMFRQTGPLRLDENDVAVRGTVIRHLIIPGQTENSLEVLRAMAAGSFKAAWISLMSQYFPAHRAPSCPPFDRRLRPGEWREVRDEALRLGLDEGWLQEME
ncbi:MAG: radical SAM protein [Acidobacteria bacterium]|nr:radical SAM protein [Acidobacteriota bacterium]MBU4307446.1 radical SAM protein [Acidobacteriota bacterium]MCG2812115.1 radical SAM protein [Candidatus Aminicenantes bacterium]